jgi:hypothetical protein
LAGSKKQVNCLRLSFDSLTAYLQEDQSSIGST